MIALLTLANSRGLEYGKVVQNTFTRSVPTGHGVTRLWQRSIFWELLSSL